MDCNLGKLDQLILNSFLCVAAKSKENNSYVIFAKKIAVRFREMLTLLTNLCREFSRCFLSSN